MQDVAHVHNSHCVAETFFVFAGAFWTHRCLQQDVNCSFAHVVVAVKLLSNFLRESSHHVSRIVVKSGHEGLEDVHVESWCDEFAMCSPLLARADEQTVSQPRLEKSVLIRFVDVHVASKNQLHVSRIGKEDGQLVSNPSSDDVTVSIGNVHGFLENFWRRNFV